MPFRTSRLMILGWLLWHLRLKMERDTQESDTTTRIHVNPIIGVSYLPIRHFTAHPVFSKVWIAVDKISPMPTFQLCMIRQDVVFVAAFPVLIKLRTTLHMTMCFAVLSATSGMGVGDS